MAKPSQSQLKGLLIVLAILAVAGTGVWIERSREDSKGLVITGTTTDIADPHSLIIPSHSSDHRRGHVHPLVVPQPQLSQPPAEVVIHVAGAVKHPGLYHLRPGARAQDGVDTAGGPKPNANLDAINLAARLEDGEQLYIPTMQEHPSGSPAVASRSAGMLPAGRIARAASARGTEIHNSKPDKLTTPGSGTVNLNTATAEDLQRLPGVGPAMSARILAYRKTNGPFKSPDQLMDVGGIGEKKYARMQPFVRVH